MTKRQAERKERLLPGGIPRWIRAYDNGGTLEGGSIDRFTVVFTGNYAGRNGCFYLAMNAAPFHPQGFGQHGESQDVIDRIGNSWGGVAVGRKHPVLGKRITFDDLPKDCKTLVMSDYREIWGLTDDA